MPPLPSWIARISDVRSDLNEKLCETQQVRVDVKARRHAPRRRLGRLSAIEVLVAERGYDIVER